MSVDYKNLKMEDVRFVYFRKNGGTVTVAYTILNRGNKGSIYRVIFDYASCNPKDRFDKKVGRNIAFGRLRKRMERLINYDILTDYSDLEFQDNPNQGLYKQTTDQIYTHLHSGDFVLPRWFYGGVKQLKCFANKSGSSIAKLIQDSEEFKPHEAKYLKSLIDERTYNF